MNHTSKWLINELRYTWDPGFLTKTRVTTSKVQRPNHKLNTVDPPSMFSTEEAFQMRGEMLSKPKRGPDAFNWATEDANYWSKSINLSICILSQQAQNYARNVLNWFVFIFF